MDISAFKAAIDEIESSEAVRVLVVTGSGGATFCSGASLPEMQTGEMSGEIFDTLTDRLSSVRQPTICGLNGSAYGGGAEIALSCDLRIGVSHARVSVPAARLGVCYPPGGLARYVKRLGLGTASRILLAAEELESDELLRTGFFTRVVEGDQLQDSVDSLATRVASLAPLAVQAMKRILGDISEGSLDRESADHLIARCADSTDFQEGLAAHFEGRGPRFEGH